MSDEEEVSQKTVGSKISDFLSGSYMALTIALTCGGLIVWSVKLENRVHELEADISRIDKRLDNFDVYGTRALANQVNSLSYHLNALDAREATASKTTSESIATVSTMANDRMNGLSTRLSNIDAEIKKIGIMEARQSEVFRRLERLETKLGQREKSTIHRFTGGEGELPPFRVGKWAQLE